MCIRDSVYVIWYRFNWRLTERSKYKDICSKKIMETYERNWSLSTIVHYDDNVNFAEHIKCVTKQAERSVASLSRIMTTVGSQSKKSELLGLELGRLLSRTDRRRFPLCRESFQSCLASWTSLQTHGDYASGLLHSVDCRLSSEQNLSRESW